MGSFSDYLENKLLDHVFKTASYTPPTNIYVALCVSTPDDDDTGTDIAAKEPSGGSYARVTCNTWNAASGGAIANTGAVTFAQATANWGTIVGFAILDHDSTGNCLGCGTLTTPKAVGTGDTISFAAGDIDITLT